MLGHRAVGLFLLSMRIIPCQETSAVQLQHQQSNEKSTSSPVLQRHEIPAKHNIAITLPHTPAACRCFHKAVYRETKVTTELPTKVHILTYKAATLVGQQTKEKKW